MTASYDVKFWEIRKIGDTSRRSAGPWTAASGPSPSRPGNWPTGSCPA
jgi:hypothetical protein